MSGPDRAHPEDPQRRVHAAEDVRGAEIILRTRRRKLIFFGGLVGFVVLVLVLSLAGLTG